jgi:argininosuccinate lyase/amino-acid N-acetyltransferase
LPFDWRLLPQDVRGSIAWATGLERAGVLAASERQTLEAALRRVLDEASKDPAAIAAAPDEDVHSYVERRLVEAVGDLGKKLHTGRSRNDQVATDLRLWVRDEIDARMAEVVAAQRSLIAFAEREIDVVLPGYTHLQRAQPVLLAHWALAYFEMLERDRERLADARGRVNLCPLGSGALAGTTFAVDRAAIARDLGFEGPTRNSLDAVSDRDFVVETLAAASLCAIHLSRLAEDLIIYSSGEFAFVELSDRVSSGSSLMPQKKNPDALELLRGKVGRIFGAHAALSVTLKGLPLAYNKDLQEDKEPLFDAMEHLALCLRVVPVVFDGMKVRADVMRRAAQGGYANATDLADYLVEHGVPFREAHEIVGKAVRHALAAGKPLEELPLSDLQRFHASISPDVFGRLKLEAVIGKRDVPGGTAPHRVREALADARRRAGI